MPIIVFDSYDATGKTNYAEALSKRLNIPLPSKFTAQLPEFDNIKDHRFWSKAQYYMLARVLSSESQIGLIMDRWIMTEYCYSPVLRGYNISDYYWDIEKELEGSDNLLWVFPSIDSGDFVKEITERFVKNNETYVTVDQTLRIKENYEKLWLRSSLPRIRIDTTSWDDQTTESNLDAITQALSDLAHGTDDATHKRLIKGPLTVPG